MPRNHKAVLTVTSAVGERGRGGRFRPGFDDQEGKRLFTNPGGFREHEDAVKLLNDFEEAVVRKRIGYGTSSAKKLIREAEDAMPGLPAQSHGAGTVLAMAAIGGVCLLVGWLLL